MRAISWIMLILVLLGVPLTIGAAIFTYINVRQVVAESPIPLPPPPQAGQAVPTLPILAATATLAPTDVAQVQGAGPATSAATALPSLSDPTRITVLLLGIDQRKGEKGPFRTDTMIVLSIDPVRKTAAMISIPRDIYIRIPVYGKADRVNNANIIGDVFIQDYPGGGPALAMRTIQSLLGVPIQRYALVNFDVFTTVIDAVGPIKVCPESQIRDDKYPDGSYGYMTVDFPAGCQELDSTKLLQYARVRHNAGDDFGRSARQQEVIRAVRDKVLSLGGVTSLIGKAGTIWGSIKDSVRTNMTFEEMVALAQIAQSIPKENIRSAVITDKDGYLMPSTLQNGDQVFSPVYEKIHELVERLFDAGTVSAANAQASEESATIIVSNGAGVDGLGKKTADKLTGKGFNVIEVKNADLSGGYTKSEIRVYTGKIKTAQLLVQTLGLDGSVITNEKKDGPPGVDIELVVGKDLADQP